MKILRLTTMLGNGEYDLPTLHMELYPEFQTMVNEQHQMVINPIMYAEWLRNFCNYIEAGAVFPPLGQVNDLIYAAHQTELEHVRNYLLEARGEYQGLDQDAAEVLTRERYLYFQLV